MSAFGPLPETLNTFGRDCAQQNLDDGEGPVLGRQPASQEEDTSGVQDFQPCPSYSIPFYPPVASEAHAATAAPSKSYSLPF